MTKRRPIETSKELVSAFADLFDETEPETPEEIDAVLLEAGYNPDEIVERVRTVVEKAIAESPFNWRNREAQLEKERARLETLSSSPQMSRGELIAAIRSILAGRQGVQPKAAGAYYRNLNEATDEDLASLLAELQYLEAQQRERPDKDEG